MDFEARANELLGMNEGRAVDVDLRRRVAEGLRLAAEAENGAVRIAALEARIAKLERSEEQLVTERDAALSSARANPPNKPSSPTWPIVLQFAAMMEAKLDRNRHKGNREGWLRDTPVALLVRLYEETCELRDAIAEGHTAAFVAEEAADVANFAMMLADVVLTNAKIASMATNPIYTPPANTGTNEGAAP